MSIIPASQSRNPGDQTLSDPRTDSLVSLLYRTVWLHGFFVILLVSNLLYPEALEITRRSE